jgi:16S rRNA (adenine1518-N6/adenine1519-N6)-dimethyltransferase
MPAGEPELPPLREVIAAAGLAAKKSLGQHFLLDLNLTRRIARAAGDISHATVLEVGPGPGGLTRGLLAEGAAEVVAVERDARAIGALQPLVAAYAGRLELIEADALTFDPAPLFARGRPVRIVANLPYNIGTVLLLHWLAQQPHFASITVMLQKEVVERLAAQPGSAAYGRLAVIAQWSHQVRRLFDVPARAFTPPPKVESSVVELLPRATPLAPADRATLERVTAAAFGQRRKMLRGSLKALGDAEALLREAGIEPTRRAEEIPIEGFCALARALKTREGA